VYADLFDCSISHTSTQLRAVLSAMLAQIERDKSSPAASILLNLISVSLEKRRASPRI
jgi:hypothetical protein